MSKIKTFAPYGLGTSQQRFEPLKRRNLHETMPYAARCSRPSLALHPSSFDAEGYRWRSNVRAFLFAALVCICATVFATEPQRWELHPDAPLPNVENRRSLAKKWTAIFIALDREIPDLSPSQQEWLNREYQEIATAGNRYTRRALAATDSHEYQIYIAKPTVQELVRTLSQLASGNARDRNAEIALWSLVAARFVDQQFWQAIASLASQNAIQKRIGGVDSLYVENYSLLAQAVLFRIVIPHLRGQLP